MNRTEKNNFVIVNIPYVMFILGTKNWKLLISQTQTDDSDDIGF